MGMSSFCFVFSLFFVVFFFFFFFFSFFFFFFFCFLTPNRINMPDWLLYNHYVMSNNNERLFVGAPHRHYRGLGRAFDK